MGKLPTGYVERYRKDIETVTLYGIPITELSLEQLQATVVYLLLKENENREQHLHNLETLRTKKR